MTKSLMRAVRKALHTGQSGNRGRYELTLEICGHKEYRYTKKNRSELPKKVKCRICSRDVVVPLKEKEA